MLGYSVTVHAIAPDVTVHDLAHVRTLPYGEAAAFAKSFYAPPHITVSERTWIDALLDRVDEGSAQLVHDGGYPYIICARGADIKAAFARTAGEEVEVLDDAQGFLVEAWDQS